MAVRRELHGRGRKMTRLAACRENSSVWETATEAARINTGRRMASGYGMLYVESEKSGIHDLLFWNTR